MASGKAKAPRRKKARPPRRKRKRAGGTVGGAAVYRGKLAKTGNSLGLRFERALFHSHPEFNGDVEAHVIGPGRMLVVALPEPKKRRTEEDPVLSSLLCFLAADMQRSPDRLTPLDPKLIARIGALVKDVKTDPAEDLGDDALI